MDVFPDVAQGVSPESSIKTQVTPKPTASSWSDDQVELPLLEEQVVLDTQPEIPP